MKPKILTFGEIIWDVYDSGSFIGGAGLNFAAHCAGCGAESYIFSAVGEDDLCDDTIRRIDELSVDTRFLQTNGKGTGRCLVTLSDNGTPSYNILCDTAYDNICLTEKNVSEINKIGFDALCFGTLIQRSGVSRSSLEVLCKSCDFREIVCDINLRENCYDKESVSFCFKKATILKISSEEEPLLHKFGLYETSDSNEQICKNICKSYPDVKYVIITDGDKGSLVYSACDSTIVKTPAKSVRVVSTVGAGDSYLAAWITAFLQGHGIHYATAIAAELSGFVVSEKGAIPTYSIVDGKVVKK